MSFINLLFSAFGSVSVYTNTPPSLWQPSSIFSGENDVDDGFVRAPSNQPHEFHTTNSSTLLQLHMGHHFDITLPVPPHD